MTSRKFYYLTNRIYLLLLALLAAVVLRYGSYLVSLYHQERGIHYLFQTLLVEGRYMGGYNGLLTLEPLSSEKRVQDGLVQSQFRFVRAGIFNADNSRVWQWRGRIALLFGLPGEAIPLLLNFVEYHPGEVSGWWELGLAYERLAKQSGEVEATDIQEFLFSGAVTPEMQMSVEAWNKGGLAMTSFLDAGEQARKSLAYTSAFQWYKRAAILNPGCGDPSYYVGRAYEDLGDWRSAWTAYRQALSAGFLFDVSRSSIYYRMGLLQQLRLEEGRPQIALAFYRMALSLDEFDTMGEAADCHYKIGEILHWLNGEPNLIIAAYKNALALNPGHVWAHMNLGVALYARDRDIARAEAELFVARDLQPTNHVVYYHLGEIYLQEGHVADARFYYLQSLTLEPEFEPAQRRLTQLEHR